MRMKPFDYYEKLVRDIFGKLKGNFLKTIVVLIIIGSYIFLKGFLSKVGENSAARVVPPSIPESSQNPVVQNVPVQSPCSPDAKPRLTIRNSNIANYGSGGGVDVSGQCAGAEIASSSVETHGGTTIKYESGD